MKKRYQILAMCFDKKGDCISHAVNNYDKTHPLQKYFAEKVGKPECIYLHAEIAAILKAKDQQIEYISIQRWNVMGHPEDAHPCPICMEAIRAFGVKRIQYTTKNGMIWEDVETNGKQLNLL